jgi:ribonucleoside-triphosphate reductase
MDLINLAFCEVMLEGDADGNIFSFPIPTYNITKALTGTVRYLGRSSG